MSIDRDPFLDPEVQALMRQLGIAHRPGLAAETLGQLAPLLAAEGVDLDNPSADLGVDELNEALSRATAQHNLFLFTPTGVHRTLALQVLFEFTSSLASDGVEAAGRVLVSVPRDPTATQPAASHVIGAGLGLLDEWSTDPAIAHKLRLVRIPKWHSRARSVATDLNVLADSGRAFDSLDSFIVRHGGEILAQGSALLVAAAVMAVAEHDGVSLHEAFTSLTGVEAQPNSPVSSDSSRPGIAFGLGRDRSVDTEISEAFGEWLGESGLVNETYLAAAEDLLAALNRLSAAQGLDISISDDFPDIIDLVGAFEDERMRDDALDLLQDYVTFQIQEHMFPEEWLAVRDMIDDAVADNDPIGQILFAAHEATLRLPQEHFAEALASTRIVTAVPTLLDWIGTSRPITGTGALRRADIATVAAMIGIRAKGVSALPASDALTLPIYMLDPHTALPQPNVWRVMSMREIPHLTSWWEALESTEIIELTASRVRPGPAVATFPSADTVELAVAAQLCADFIALVLVHGAIDQPEYAPFAAGTATSEQAIQKLLDAVTPAGVTPVDIVEQTALHRLVTPRALQKIQILADAGFLTLTKEKIEIPAAFLGIIADAVDLALRYLAVDQYARSITR